MCQSSMKITKSIFTIYRYLLGYKEAITRGTRFQKPRVIVASIGRLDKR